MTMYITTRGVIRHTKIDVSKIMDELNTLLNTFPYNQPWDLKE